MLFYYVWEGGEDLRLLKLPEEYLKQRLKNGGMTIRVVALGNDGLAVTEDHGLVRLSDDEQEQGQAWVARKCGMPMMRLACLSARSMRKCRAAFKAISVTRYPPKN
jgi:hypothetical protein